MELSSGPVTLRALESEDLDRVVGYLAHRAAWGVRGLRGDRLGPMSRAEIRSRVEDWPKKEQGQFLAIEVSDELVGHVEMGWDWDAISPHVWVFVAPEHRRLGYGSAAARMSIDWLFNHMPAATVQAWVAEPAAGAVVFAQSVGFVPVGRVRRTGIKDGAYYDDIPLQILRDEWEAARAR